MVHSVKEHRLNARVSRACMRRTPSNKAGV